MADKNPKEGDEVHAARDGNDVAKQASELTKESTDITTNDSATSSTALGAAEPSNANGDEEGKKEVEIGEKRDRVEGEEKPAAQELAEAEKDAGKEAKKPKLAKDAIDGEGENSGASNGGDDAASPPKKRGPGRPKKSEREAKKRDEAVKPEASSAETISGRTRSKAS